MPKVENSSFAGEAVAKVSSISAPALLIMGHACHVVDCGLAAKRGHGGIIRGDEIADDNAHGAVTQEFAGGIVVSGRDFEDVAGGKLVAATIEEQHGWHAEEFALVVDFGVERGDCFFARGILKGELFRVVVHVAANS